MSVLFLMLTIVYIASSTCLYTQSHWLDNSSMPWPHDLEKETMCGLSYHRLMHLNVSQSASSDSFYWLLVFHQLCTIKLSLAMESSSTTMPSTQTLLTDFLLDSMSHRCDNLSNWVEETRTDPIILSSLNDLLLTIRQSPSCEEKTTPFEIDRYLLFLDYNESAIASERDETMGRTYRMNNLLIGVSSLAYFLIIPGLFLCVTMLRDKQREYRWLPIEEDNTHHHDDDKESITPLDDEIEMTNDWLEMKKR